MKTGKYKNFIGNFLISMAACLFMFGGDLSALDIQAQLGVAGVGVWDSPTDNIAAAIMPLAAVQASVGEHGHIKLEAGALSYTLAKTGRESGAGGKEILSRGEVDIEAYSLALIWVSDWGDNARVNVGAGVINHKYDPRISSGAEAQLAANGVFNVDEEIGTTSGFQLILGMDFFLTDNLLFGLSYRMADIRSEAGVSAVYPTGKGTEYEKIDFSHKLACLSLTYQFGR